jgi:hypothetical protein
MSEPASIIFESGKTGEVNYRRYGGEEQPEEENLLLLLSAGDCVNYLYHTDGNDIMVVVAADGEGELMLSTGLQEAILKLDGKNKYRVSLKVPSEEKKYLWAYCTDGKVKLDYIELSNIHS